jgi:hypothetical protein
MEEDVSFFQGSFFLLALSIWSLKKREETMTPKWRPAATVVWIIIHGYSSVNYNAKDKLNCKAGEEKKRDLPGLLLL